MAVSGQRANTCAFVHSDGRLETVGSPLFLSSVGGAPLYICRVLEASIKELPPLGCNIWVSWQGNRIPCPADATTVLLLIGDERAQIPAHAEKFLCCFMTGTRSTGFENVFGLGKPVWQQCLELARCGQNSARRIVKWAREGAPLYAPGKVLSLPIGDSYPASATPIPIPMGDRKWDVSFLGSVGRYLSVPWSSGHWRIGVNPKTSARLNLLSGFDAFQKKHPAKKAMVRLIDLPEYEGKLDQNQYAHVMAHLSSTLGS